MRKMVIKKEKYKNKIKVKVHHKKIKLLTQKLKQISMIIKRKSEDR